MQKLINRICFIFAIVVGVLGIAAALTFFLLIPSSYLAIKGSEFPIIDLFVSGLKGMVLLNLLSGHESEILVWVFWVFILISILVFLFLTILWLIFLLVKKRKFEFITFAIAVVFGLVSIVLLPAFMLGYCGAAGDQVLVFDIFGAYPDNPVLPTGETPHILAIVTFIVLVFNLFSIELIMFVEAIAVWLKPLRLKERKEAKLEARHKYEESLITYVDYVAGKDSREKEYERILAANGIKQPKVVEKPVVDVEAKYYEEVGKELRRLQAKPRPVVLSEEDKYYEEVLSHISVLDRETSFEKNMKEGLDGEEAYYQEVGANLLNSVSEVEEPVVIEDDDPYYKEVADHLGILHEQPKVEEESEEDAYYKDVVKHLGILHEKPVVEEKEDPYYKDVVDNLGVLHEKPVEDNSKCYEELSKELGLFTKEESSKKVSKSDAYYEEVIKNLGMLSPSEKVEVEHDYYEELSKELGLEKQPVVKEEKEEIPVNILTEEEYYSMVSKGLALERSPKVVEEEPVENDKGYYEGVSKELGLEQEPLKRAKAQKVARRNIYEEVSNELSILHESKAAHEKAKHEVSDDERLAELKAMLKKTKNKKSDYYKQLSEELEVLKKSK